MPSLVTDEIRNEEAEKERKFLEAEQSRAFAKTKNLRSKERQLSRDEAFLHSIGESLPAEPSESFVVRALDALDTPRQWIAGQEARLFGVPEYEDAGAGGASALAAKENLRFADILRRSGTKIPFTDRKFADFPALRGAVGFLGDVVSDPLSYLSFGSQGARIAGKAVTNTPVATKFGQENAMQIFERVSSANAKKHLDDLASQFADIGVPPHLEAQAKLMGERQATNQFSMAREGILGQRTQASRLGLTDLVPEQLEAAEASKIASRLLTDEAAEDTLNVLNPEDIDKLFKRGAVRFTGPFAGVPGLSKIPLLGERELDIPLVSEASERVQKVIGQGYYGSKVKVKNFINDGLKDSPDSFFYKTGKAFIDSLGGGHSKLVGGLSELSRRIQASGEIFGSSFKRDFLQQHERDRMALFLSEVQNASWAGKDVLKFEDKDELFKDVTRFTEQAMKTLRGAGKAADPEVAFETAMQGLRQKYSSIPEKGAAAETFARHIHNDFKRMAQVEQEAGLLDNAYDIYINHMYDKSGTAKEYFESMKLKLKGAPDASLPRAFASYDEARAFGLKPEENALNLYTFRRYAHQRALAEKDFFERAAYQWAMPKPVYDELTRLSREGSTEIRRRSMQALKDYGIKESGDLLPLVYRLGGENGPVLDPDQFKYYGELFSKGDPTSAAYQIAQKQVKAFTTDRGIDPATFFTSPEHANDVALKHQTFKGTTEMLLGREGEGTFTRASGTTLKPFMRERLLKSLSPEDRVFYEGVVPQSFHDALDESLNTFDLLKKHVEKEGADIKNPFYKALSSSLNWLGHMGGIYRKATTSVWPAFHVRNLYSAGFQPAELMSTGEQIMGAAGGLLGGAKALGMGAIGAADKLTGMDLGRFLNFHGITRAQGIIEKGLDVVDVYGKRISNSQLRQEALQAGLTWNTQLGADLVSSMNDMLDQMTRSPALLGAIPELKRFQKEGQKGLYAAAKNWARTKTGLTLSDKHWVDVKGFGERLESFGRTHTFINLRSRGYDFESASAATNRMLVDYANGKTAFERDILNKIFFFYSFSRGNATNMVMNMVRKPGTLTTQLHAINGVADMLRQPGAFIDEPDVEESVRTTRLSEGISVYLGRNEKTGMTEFLQQTGLPVEDLTKWSTVYKPTGPTVGEVLIAGGKSAQRSYKLIAGQTNPIVKTAIETLTGRSLYYDRPITDEVLRKIPKWEKDISTLQHIPFRVVPDAVWRGLDKVTQEALDGRDNGDGTYTINPYKMAWIVSLVPGLKRFIDTRAALTKPGVSEGKKALRALTGVQSIQVDPDQSVTYDRAKRMDEHLTDLGIPKAKRERLRMLEAMQEGEDEE